MMRIAKFGFAYCIYWFGFSLWGFAVNLPKDPWAVLILPLVLLFGYTAGYFWMYMHGELSWQR